MTAAQAGDAAAYRLLLGEVQGWLNGFFARRAGPGVVDDLVQETMLALHNRRHTYDPAYPLLPWLKAIARYKWVDHIRRQLRAAEVELLEDAAQVPAGEWATIASHVLGQLLPQLPAGQAAAITSVKLEGRSIDEAARLTGQSPSLVKVNIHRGLKRLAALLERTDIA